MNAQTIRNQYLKFFADRGHAMIPRARLVPQNDSTTLFTGSGMQSLLPYLLGQSHPAGVRLTDSQTCLRAQDIEDVGDNRHTTFFEMLGNWSLGDYFKEQQIRWFFSFLTDVVGLDPHKIYVTCFIGDTASGIARDDESASIWQQVFTEKGIEAKIVSIGSQSDGDKVGMQGGRIFFYDDGENWWSRGGGLAQTPLGDPCGPDSEVFYDYGDANHDTSYGLPHPASDSGRFVEIGNQVFMQYQRTEAGFKPLDHTNVDFGGGLERIAAAAIDSPDVFKISLLWPIIEKLVELSGKKYESHTESMRVIADHLRAATFLAVDGIVPSNKEQGYVMRRLLRRAIRYAFELGVEQNLCEHVIPVIADLYKDDYPEVLAERDAVIATLVKEEKIFRQTLKKGLAEFSKLAVNEVNGETLFKLYDTYGFPVELTKEEAFTQSIPLADTAQADFDNLMQAQRDRSRTATKGEFKGGLSDHSEMSTKYHTATHLLYQALRMVLGEHVVQRGSNNTPERLRFDFSHGEKMTLEQIAAVEAIVNEQITNDLVVTFEEHPTDVAIHELHALGQFGDRYGDRVKIYRMQAPGTKKPFSFEICGGPHVDHTARLAEGGKQFNIIKEESSSAGVRRIKAVLS